LPLRLRAIGRLLIHRFATGHSPADADDPGVGRLGIIAVVLALLGAGRCYTANWDDAAASLPFAQAGAPPPKSLESIGKPAAPTIPDIDFKKWFSTDPAADPYDATIWGQVAAVTAEASNQAGWTEVCKKVSSAAGGDRGASPLLGALACSSDPAVTRLQQFAVQLLSTRAALALWIRGAPGIGSGTVRAHQAEVRLTCAGDVVAREAGPSTPFGQACAKAMDNAYAAGDGKTSFTALGDAYTLVAAELAKRSPKVAQEPAYFDAKNVKK